MIALALIMTATLVALTLLAVLFACEIGLCEPPKWNPFRRIEEDR